MICTVTLNTAIDKVLVANGFHPGRHLKVQVGALSPAGKGINVSRGLARLGLNTLCCGFAGRHQLPFFRDNLIRNGIQCMLTPCEADTRTNTTIIDPSGGTATHLREPGFRISSVEWSRLKDDMENAFEEHAPETVAFCGSLPDGVNARECIELLQLAKRHDAETVLDVGGKEGRALIESGLVDAVKPNLEELRQFLDADISAKQAPEAAAALLRFVGTVLLTLGAGGAVLISGEDTLGARCPLDDEEIASTVGCGDAFLAGWLDGRRSGLPAERCLALGVACAAAATWSKTAADYGADDVQSCLSRVIPVTVPRNADATGNREQDK